MRSIRAALALAAIAATGMTLANATPAEAVCSVFRHHPCAPTVCSPFHGRPCLPEWDYPIGQDLRLTVETTSDAVPAAAAHSDLDGEGRHKLDTLRKLFAALRGCWVPPPIENAHEGMQMSVRFSFKRTGELVGEPRITYVTPNASAELKDIYRQAISAAIDRCTPLPLSDGLGGAIAGRPIAIRFIDNRTTHVESP